MLVLSRKIGEAIRIGADVDIVILEVSRGRVRLGFSGPKTVPVRRTELLKPSPQESSASLLAAVR